jgi:hypothetical protein
MFNVYVGRHGAALEWAKAHGLPTDAATVNGNATAANVAGKVVWGVVPLHLASGAAEVHVIEFDSPPRGVEYTVADMERAGARWGVYVVTKIG